MTEETVCGLDTSLVLRIVTEDPPDQADLARLFVEQAFASGSRLQISDLVVTEAYYALQSYYGIPKREAAEELLYLLSLPAIESTGQARAALKASLEGSAKPGLVDRMIHLDYQPARLVTFEKAASRLEGALVLK